MGLVKLRGDGRTSTAGGGKGAAGGGGGGAAVAQALQRMRVGHIPGGSTDAVAYT